MKCQTIGNEDKICFRIELSERFDIYDFEQCFKELLTSKNWKKSANILWDARNCSIEHLDFRDLNEIAEMINKYSDIRGNGKSAWVSGRDVDFGVSRMFELINEGQIVQNFRGFKSINDAEKWLESDEL